MARTSKKGKKTTGEGCSARIYSVGIYARLSRDADERKNESIETQMEMCRAYVDAHGDMELFDCYTDLGKTGTNFDRDGFERLMQDVRMRKVDCIIVKDLSRFGRSHIEMGNYLGKIFPFLGVRFIALTDRFDSLGCTGDDMTVQLKNLVNEMYARDISVKVRASKEKSWQGGNFNGFDAPYGYRLEHEGNKRVLTVDEGPAAIVRRICEMYLEGMTYRGISEWLYGEGIHTPRDYRAYKHVRRQGSEELHGWSNGTICRTLCNHVYAGFLTTGKKDGKAVPGRKIFPILRGEWPAVRGNHEPIIPEDMFMEVIKKYESSPKREHPYRIENDPAPEDIYRGLLFCGLCGHRYIKQNIVRHKGGKCIRYLGYSCGNRKRIDGDRCESGRITRNALDAAVGAAIHKEYSLAGLRQKDLVSVSHDRARRDKDAVEREIQGKRGHVGRLKDECSEAYMRYRSGDMDRQGFESFNGTRKKEIGKLEEEIKALDKKLKDIDAVANRRDHFLRAVIKGTEDGFLTGEVLHALIRRIEIFPDKRIAVHFKFSRNDFVDACGKE